MKWLFFVPHLPYGSHITIRRKFVMFEIAIFAGEINPYTALHNINYIFSGIESDAGMCG